MARICRVCVNKPQRGDAFSAGSGARLPCSSVTQASLPCRDNSQFEIRPKRDRLWLTRCQTDNALSNLRRRSVTDSGGTNHDLIALCEALCLCVSVVNLSDIATARTCEIPLDIDSPR